MPYMPYGPRLWVATPVIIIITCPPAVSRKEPCSEAVDLHGCNSHGVQLVGIVPPLVRGIL